VSISKLRRWEQTGKLACVSVPGGHRRYRLSDIDFLERSVRSLFQNHALNMLEIITVFSARLDGAHSRKDQRLIDGVNAALQTNG
jgi:predicted site-specific integrase-resolvase